MKLVPCRLGAAILLVALSSAAAWPAGPTRDGHPSAESVVRALQNDDALLERVANALANDPELGDADITVFVGEGRVALQGRTRTAGQAVRAVAVSRRAAGSGVEVRSTLTSVRPRDAAAA
jgi:hypothetical protein